MTGIRRKSLKRDILRSIAARRTSQLSDYTIDELIEVIGAFESVVYNTEDSKSRPGQSSKSSTISNSASCNTK